MMNKIICRGYRFPPEIIQRAIWLYYRFTLSLRDVDELLAERGIEMTLRDERAARAASMSPGNAIRRSLSLFSRGT
jgi:transposase-like protein